MHGCEVLNGGSSRSLDSSHESKEYYRQHIRPKDIQDSEVERSRGAFPLKGCRACSHHTTSGIRGGTGIRLLVHGMKRVDGDP